MEGHRQGLVTGTLLGKWVKTSNHRRRTGKQRQNELNDRCAMLNPSRRITSFTFSLKTSSTQAHNSLINNVYFLPRTVYWQKKTKHWCSADCYIWVYQTFTNLQLPSRYFPPIHLLPFSKNAKNTNGRYINFHLHKHADADSSPFTWKKTCFITLNFTH